VNQLYASQLAKLHKIAEQNNSLFASVNVLSFKAFVQFLSSLRYGFLFEFFPESSSVTGGLGLEQLEQFVQVFTD
jgi:hypothetical protein